MSGFTYPLSRLINSILLSVNQEKLDFKQQQVTILLENGITSYEDILQAVENRNETVIEAVSYLLSYFNQSLPKILYKAVDTLLQSEKIELRILALNALSEKADWRAVRRLLNVAEKDTNTYVRNHALFHIWGAGNAQAVPRLIRLLNNKNEVSEVRESAAESIANIRDTSALSSLRKALSDDSAEVRFWACYALGQLKDEFSIPQLKQLAANDTGVSEKWGSVSKEASDSIRYIKTGIGFDDESDEQT